MDSLIKKFNKLTDKQKTLLALGVFALLILAFYGNTLTNGFFTDDFGIQRNENLKSIQNIHKVFTSCVWELEDNGCKTTFYPYYRPMYYFSVFLTYQISPQPWAFHLFSLFYFFAAAVVIFLFAKKLTKNFFVGFLAALFFIIHPANSEVVNWISLSSDPALLIFGGLSLLFYLKYREKGQTRHLWYVYLFYFLALLSKEPAILLPGMMLAIDFLFFRQTYRKFLRTQEFKKYILFLIPTAIYLVMRIYVLGFAFGGKSMAFTFTEGIWARVVIFAQYIKFFFIPYPLSLYHPFSPSSDFLSPTFLLALLVVLAFFSTTFFFIKKRQNLVVFSLFWFALFFIAPIISLVGEDATLLTERYLYMPSVGLLIAIAYGTHRLFSISSLARYGVVAVLLFTMLVSWMIVFPRNREWKNDETFYRATLQGYQDAHRIRRDLAQLYFAQGDYEAERQEYEELIRRAPDWKDITMAHKALGDYWRTHDDLDEALRYYIQSTQVSTGLPRDYVPFNDVGLVYLQREQHLLALTYFCQSQQLFQTEQTQSNFDASFIAVDEQFIQPGILHNEIISSFVSSPTQRIQYLDNRCDDETCQYAFGYNADIPEVLPPFLITSQTARGNNVEIINKSYDPNQSVIVLETDAVYENTDLTFLFPTCGREYYEANTTN